jgi:hypothetical protein
MDFFAVDPLPVILRGRRWDNRYPSIRYGQDVIGIVSHTAVLKGF